MVAFSLLRRPANPHREFPRSLRQIYSQVCVGAPCRPLATVLLPQHSQPRPTTPLHGSPPCGREISLAEVWTCVWHSFEVLTHENQNKAATLRTVENRSLTPAVA